MLKNKQWQWSMIFAFGMVLVTYILGFRLDRNDLLPDVGASWYYWKLPQRDFVASLSAWLGYGLHQVFFWYALFMLRKNKANPKPWQFKLLVGNGFFILLHLIQSHIWYDGLAQDVPVFSSQGSVIGMLVLVLIIEMDRRGLIFGKKIRGFDSVKNYIKAYHGYYIAWAITYTFWYHPMVSTHGHLVGFFYLFILFLQGSMAYSRVHINRKWTFVLEVTVLFHGTIVAIGQANNMWPMFGFGFAFIAVFTQIYGLNIQRQTRLAIQGLHIIGALVAYVGGFAGKSPAMLHQVTWIPIIEYALVFVILFFGNILLLPFKKPNKAQ